MTASRLSVFPWEWLHSLYNPNNQTRRKSLQCLWPVNSMPSLGHFLTPPEAVWILANIFIGSRKGGLPLFSYSRSSEVCLGSQQLLTEAGPERTALQGERGLKQSKDGSKHQVLHRTADLERFGKSNDTSFLTGLFPYNHPEQRHNHAPNSL